jgi:hypothetical protein
MLGALIFVFGAGFVCGYAVRAYISHRRRNRYLTSNTPRDDRNDSRNIVG